MKLYQLLLAKVILFAIYVMIGAYCFDYCLLNMFGKNVPWIADAVAGMIAGAVTVPGAIVLWILKLCGIAMPLIHG